MMDEVPFVIRFQTSPMIYFLLLAVKYIYRNQERFVKRNALIAVEIPRWLGFLKINRGFLTEDTGWEGSFYKSVSFDPNKGNQEGSFVFKRPKMSNQTTSNPLTRSDPRITTSHLDSQKEEFEDEPTLASRVMSISLNVSEDSALVETQLAAIATTATADDHQHERFSAGGPSPSSTYESMITPRKLKAYASLLSLRSTSSLAPLPSSTTPDVPAQKVMGKFLSGFQRFHKTYFASNGNFFESLRHRQSPKTLIIGCSDSRVDPAIITDCDPGDLFVVRNVANLVAPYEPNYKLHGVSAALEFAIKTLKVESIIVLGHTHCGGIEHLMEGDSQDTEFLWAWMQIARRAKERTLKYFGDQEKRVRLKACEHASILNSLENLLTYPWIKKPLQEGKLSLSGWYFDFDQGSLLSYNPDTKLFEPLTHAPPSSVTQEQQQEQLEQQEEEP